MIEGPTKRIVVQYFIDANKVSAFLISRAAAFELTPLPDDGFAFVVKDEGHAEAIALKLKLFPFKNIPIPSRGPMATVTPEAARQYSAVANAWGRTPYRSPQQAAHDPEATQEELDRLDRGGMMDLTVSAG
jgi:hypothetical protein